MLLKNLFYLGVFLIIIGIEGGLALKYRKLVIGGIALAAFIISCTYAWVFWSIYMDPDLLLEPVTTERFQYVQNNWGLMMLKFSLMPHAFGLLAVVVVFVCWLVTLLFHKLWKERKKKCKK